MTPSDTKRALHLYELACQSWKPRVVMCRSLGNRAVTASHRSSLISILIIAFSLLTAVLRGACQLKPAVIIADYFRNSFSIH